MTSECKEVCILIWPQFEGKGESPVLFEIF